MLTLGKASWNGPGLPHTINMGLGCSPAARHKLSCTRPWIPCPVQRNRQESNEQAQ